MSLVTDHEELLRLQGVGAASADSILGQTAPSAVPPAAKDEDEIPEDVAKYAAAKLHRGTLTSKDIIAALLALFGGDPFMLDDDEGNLYSFTDILDGADNAPAEIATFAREVAAELRNGDYATRPEASALAEALTTERFDASAASTPSGVLRMYVVINEVLAERRERAVQLIASASDSEYANKAAEAHVLRRHSASFDQRLEDALLWFSTMDPDRLNRAIEDQHEQQQRG